MSVVTLTASGQEPPVTYQEYIKCSLLSREDLKVLWEASYLLEGPNQKKSLGGESPAGKKGIWSNCLLTFQAFNPSTGTQGQAWAP